MSRGSPDIRFWCLHCQYSRPAKDKLNGICSKGHEPEFIHPSDMGGFRKEECKNWRKARCSSKKS